MRHRTTYGLLCGFLFGLGLQPGCAGSGTEYSPPPGVDGGSDAAATSDLAMQVMCQLVPQSGCLATQKCTSHDAATTLCDPNGSVNRGERCMTTDGVDNCYAGNACANQGNNIGLCRAWCRSDVDCGTRSYCELPLGTAGMRLCTQPCNVFGAGCPSGLACYAYNTEHTDCRLPGTKAEGQACVRAEDCMAGMTCLGPAGGESCRKLCPRTTGAGCSTGQSCYIINNGDGTQWATYGFCY